MPNFNNNEATTNIDDVINTQSGDIVSYNKDLTEKATERGLGTAHQPFIIAIDASGSMIALATDGKTKLDMCQELINSLPQSENIASLSDAEKDCVDMLVLSFSNNDVNIHSTWRPLSVFEGITPIHSGTTTPLYKAIIESIQASRVMRHSYSQNGIDCKRPQIFIYTDGLATDPENRAEAKKLCQLYTSKQSPKAKLFVVLVPGAMSEEQIQNVSQDLVDLCDDVTLIKVDDCKNGLPATFNFLSSSVVVGTSSSIGADMLVRYDKGNNGNMQFGNTPVSNGTAAIGRQVIFTA